ncbi:hypothetical protein HYW87_04740 [Candidatus Roizmanbacteria bacterium]|nr:hypothetical protein [Candidatus Roizmanbacteria bacterium]
MSKLEYPNRIFSLSDCHGGRAVWNPLESPDVAARLAEAIRSDLQGVQHFDTFGAPGGFNQHVVAEAVRLHRQNPDSGRTGLFINSAARMEANNNGQPFFRADFVENLVVVATPLSVLSGVRDSVRKLLELPNENNGLYDGEREQHRSSYTPRLLAENHGLPLKEADTSCIPELPASCKLAYIDRFGNLVFSEAGAPEAQSILARIAKDGDRAVQLRIGDVVQTTTIGQSLSGAEPGSLVIYENDGGVEIVSKWDKDWTIQQRLDNSAYEQFGEPTIGASCVFEN